MTQESSQPSSSSLLPTTDLSPLCNNIFLSTASWEEQIKIDWIGNMTRHVKYWYHEDDQNEDEKEKYLKKDHNLLRIAGQNLDGGNGDIVCSVIPLNEISKVFRHELPMQRMQCQL